MGRITTVTSKGQVTIPKEVRDKLDIAPADRIEFIIEDGTARIRKYALRVRDVVGTVPPLALPLEEVMRIAKEDRAEQWLNESIVRFVDANVFVRALAWDDPAKARRCAELFELAEQGEARLVTSEAIVAEVFHVMMSPKLYAMPRPRLATLMRPLVVARGLFVEHKASVLAAIDLYETSNLDFEDCLAVQHMVRQRLDGIYSYDHGFRPALGITRYAP